MPKMAKALLRTVLATVPSESRPNVHYEIRLGADNRVYCSCPAWKFSRAHTCKHLTAFRAAVQQHVA